MMIVISIVFIVSLTVYAPYSHYQKKAQFRLIIKQTVQLIQQARNSAIYGGSEGVNHSYGVYLDSAAESARLISYPYNATGSLSIDAPNVADVKTLDFPKNLQVNSIAWELNTLLLYQAISGELEAYTVDISGNAFTYSSIPDIIEINMSYWDPEKSSFVKTLEYYTQSHVIDF